MPSQINVGTGSGGYGTSILRLTAIFRKAGVPDIIAYEGELVNDESPLEFKINSLVIGDNTIAVTPIAAGVIFIPPTSNTTHVFKLKVESGGSVSITLHPRAPTMITFTSPPPTSIFINSTLATDGTRFIFF